MQESNEADIKAIKEVIERLTKAYVKEDAETFVSAFSDDTVCMLPNMPQVNGIEEWRSIMNGMFESSTPSEHTFEIQEINLAGDWAFELHTDSALYTSKATGESHRSHFKGTFIFRRQPDGSWKIARYVTNTNPAPEE